MFPPGPPGVALVLLRVAVALTVLLHVYARQDMLPAWFLTVLLLLAMMLVVGVLTPVVALAAIAVQVIGLPAPTVPNTMLVAGSILHALALALLGPGAYSVDALRFGRRVVDLPAGEDK